MIHLFVIRNLDPDKKLVRRRKHALKIYSDNLYPVLTYGIKIFVVLQLNIWRITY